MEDTKPTVLDGIKAIMANLPNVPKKYTTWVIAIASTIGTIWLGLPADVQAEIIKSYPLLRYVPAAVGVLGAILSAVHQGLPTPVAPGDIAASKAQ